MLYEKAKCRSLSISGRRGFPGESKDRVPEWISAVNMKWCLSTSYSDRSVALLYIYGWMNEGDVAHTCWLVFIIWIKLFYKVVHYLHSPYYRAAFNMYHLTIAWRVEVLTSKAAHLHVKTLKIKEWGVELTVTPTTDQHQTKHTHTGSRKHRC